MDSIGGMLNSIGKMPKLHYKNNFVRVLLEKANVYNGILMETIGIYVMVSIGLLLFFLTGRLHLMAGRKSTFILPRDIFFSLALILSLLFHRCSRKERHTFF